MRAAKLDCSRQTRRVPRDNCVRAGKIAARSMSSRSGVPACRLLRFFAQTHPVPLDRLVLCGRWAPVPGIRYPGRLFDGVPVVATPAEIDISTTDEFRAVLLEATSNGHPMVVVDMTGTQFCDCAGLHTLLRAHERVLAEGRGLRLVIPADGAVPRILALTGSDRFIPCFASLADALAQRPDGASPRPGACGPDADHSQVES
jgi:anti-sigma B factor antagonist